MIELGCGPGAAGIAAAASAQPPATVTLTDLPHLLPLVQQNIKVRWQLPAVVLCISAAAVQCACYAENALQRLKVPGRQPTPLRCLPQANGVGHLATAAPLAWGTPLSSSGDPVLRPPFDVVLASDVLYQAEALPLFVRTLRELSGPATLTLLCNEHRPALPFPWQLFRQAGFDVQQVPLSEQHPDWRSKDIHLFHIRLASSSGAGGKEHTSSSAAVE